MRFGSVFSGIEAASVAWDSLGWDAAWVAEVDLPAAAVLAHRLGATAPKFFAKPEDRKRADRFLWGDRLTNWGDMTELPALVLSGEAEAPDILAGGSPCQAFSVAGRREGLGDKRGQLVLSYVDLADAIDIKRAERGEPPCIIFWENVPGVLSDKTNAFGCFLAGLAGEDVPLEPAGGKWTDAGVVVGPQRTIAWRCIDAQYVGLAQRRKRVFVVASARDGFDPAAVLLEFEGLRRDSAPSREPWEDVAGTLAARTDGGGFPGTDEACSGYVRVVGPERSAGVGYGGGRTGGPVNVAACLVAKGQKLDFEVETFVVHGTQDPCVSETTAFALGRNSGGENVIAFSCKDHGADATVDIAPTMRAMSHDGSHANAGGQLAVCVTGDVSHTLTGEGFDASEDGTGRGNPIVAFVQSVALRGREGGGSAELGGDLATALRASGGGGDKPHVLAFTTEQTPKFDVDRALTLTKQSPTGGGQIQSVFANMAVRRLMPIECERLQGFPDDYTNIPMRNGSRSADGPRYKQLGNSWPVPVVTWIGKRIAAQLAAVEASVIEAKPMSRDAFTVWITCP